MYICRVLKIEIITIKRGGLKEDKKICGFHSVFLQQIVCSKNVYLSRINTTHCKFWIFFSFFP